MISDALQERIHCGDRDAFRALYSEYSRDVYLTACEVLKDEALARAVVKQVFLRIYRELLEWTKSTLPAIKFVLHEPYVLEFGAVGDDWLAEIDARRKVVRKLAKDFDAVLIPTQDILNKAAKRVSKEYWLADGVHPLLAGHQLIADAWLKAVKF